jgi:hypothetical protein
MKSKMLAVALLSLTGFASTSRAAIIVTADKPYGTNNEVFTVDPDTVGGKANRGMTTTRELRQSFKNPTTFDVRRIVTSLDINNAATGLLLKFYEVDNTTVDNIGNPVNGTVFRTLTIPAGTYGTSTTGMEFLLTGDDVFTLPQRNAGTTGYALGISQIDTAGTNSGVWHFANAGGDHYTDGKFYVEGGGQSSPSRDGGLAISSVPEPASVALLIVGLAAAAAATRRRRGA